MHATACQRCTRLHYSSIIHTALIAIANDDDEAKNVTATTCVYSRRKCNLAAAAVRRDKKQRACCEYKQEEAQLSQRDRALLGPCVSYRFGDIQR